MRTTTLAVAVLAATFVAQNAGAKTLEDVLKLQGDVTNAHDQSKRKSDDQIYRLQAQVIF